MAKNSRDDNRNFIITSKYKHKSTKLSNFVEKEVVDRFESYQLSDTSSQVENRKESRKWLEKVKNTALEAMSNISDYRKDGKNPPEFDALIEEERLKVLHEIGWSYTDNFITRKKSKRDPSDTSTSDPETSFMISTEEIGNVLYYRASYGIVRGVANKSIGNYTYTLTLDEAIRFIRREFETSGKTAMSRKLLEAKKRQLKMERSDRRLNINDLNKEVENELNKVWNQNNINKVIKRVQDSADITTIADFIEFFLAPIARKMHYEAFKHEKELQGAQRIQDRNMVDLDKPRLSTPEDSVIKLKETTRTNSDGVEEKRFVPINRNDKPVDKKNIDNGEDPIEENSVEKNDRPVTIPPVHTNIDKTRKNIKNSERVQIKKPLLPPVPSIPLMSENNGVDLDETTDNVADNLNIDKPATVQENISDKVEEKDIVDNNIPEDSLVETNAERDNEEVDIHESHDDSNSRNEEIVEENENLHDSIPAEEIESEDTETIVSTEEPEDASRVPEESSEYIPSDEEGDLDDNKNIDLNKEENTDVKSEDIISEDTEEDTNDEDSIDSDDTAINENEINTDDSIDPEKGEIDNISNKENAENNIEENDQESELSRIFSDITSDNEESEEGSNENVIEESVIIPINNTVPEFVNNNEHVEENILTPINETLPEFIDNNEYVEENDHIQNESENINDSENVVDQEIHDTQEFDIENNDGPEEFVNISDEHQEESSAEELENDKENTEDSQNDNSTEYEDEIEIEEIPEPRIDDDIIDEFDDFLQDEEELMLRGEEINSALDDFNSEDITAILKDSIPELFDVSRMPVRENDGRAEEINNMMDDFLDFEDEFYDDEEDK